MTSAEELPSGDDLDELEDGTREQSTQSGAEEEQSNLDELGDGTREQSTQSGAEVELNPDDEMPRSYPAGAASSSSLCLVSLFDLALV